MPIAGSTKENRYSNLMRDYALQLNAISHFRSFLDRVTKNMIKEDGSDKLLGFIDRYVVNDAEGQFHKTLKTDKILYRARIIRDYDGLDVLDGKTSGYGESGSREVSLGTGVAGRNNIEGVSYLYLADKPETACAEVKPIVRSLLSVARFRIAKPVYIFDFSEDKRFMKDNQENVALGLLFSMIMQQYYTPVENTIEYRSTQIITDHLRKTGIDGIAYKSFYDRQGTNYTIFNSSRDRFEFLDSKIMMVQSERRTFLDFNERKVLDASTMGYATYNQQDAEEMLESIKIKINQTNKK